MQHRRRRVGQRLLGVVDLGALEHLQPGDLVQRQIGEEAQEPAHVAVVSVPPELPVIVGREPVRVEPHRAGRGLAHLAAVGGGDERRGEAVELRPVDAAGELDPVDDIAPLVRPAELEPAGRAARQFQEIIGLEDHVVEFEEGERLLAVQPQLHRIEGQHPVDREMRPDLAQEGDIVERVEPVGIVGHDRVGRAVAEVEKPLEHAADRGDVGGDVLVGEQLAALVAAGRIADLGGAAAHQHDRPVPRLLEPTQHHDLHQGADMERRRGRVEADIAGHDLLRSERVERGGIGHLMDIAARGEQA